MSKLKTDIIVERPFMGYTVRQRTKSEFFNATDLVKIANVKRMELGKSIFNFSQFMSRQSTQEFVEELQKEYPRVIIKGRGRNSQTWVHPLLFIDIALNIDPKLKLVTYKWLQDSLIKYRNESGLAYNKMTGSLFDLHTNKREFNKFIQEVASFVKKELDVTDWNKASEEKLKERELFYEKIYTFSTVIKDPYQAVRLGIQSFRNEKNTEK